MRGNTVKAILTIGISGSGKTFWAEQQEGVVVSRDDIRLEILVEKGHRDALTSNMWQYWKWKDEDKVTEKYHEILNRCASIKKDVICCDTNLSEKHRISLENYLISLGYTVEHKIFDVPLMKCVDRDKYRQHTVGFHTIYDQWKRFKKQFGSVTPIIASGNDCVICDIDGTIAHMSYRTAFEWDKVHTDTFDFMIGSMLDKFYSQGMKIIFVSGRDGVCYRSTYDWLKKNFKDYGFDLDSFSLYMRAEGDNRPDEIVKVELYNKYINGLYNVMLVLDDRPKVCREWMALGLKTMIVGDPYKEF